ncbi:hypothetical protein [Agromyces kandeliae]|uniref:Large exoprotein n=1 Tax=Agromyces kandeliae TaxID=2666141 RepID=A0A6L5R4U9_9MICO|nr:hypothetical protein [Agromyces kandeliae]MRX44107.1 hypothetical protein [Agromyces kandeliae]
MDPIGGGVLVAVAATLWIAYLLPSWLRRRQYLATERNAVRLQQTLRILAETAEAPEEVRTGVSAREVAAQERILHEHELAARLEAQAAENLAIAERIAAEEAAAAAERELAAQAERVAAAEREAARPVEADAASARSAAAPGAPSAAAARRARRRRRAMCSLLLLASLVAVVAGLVMLALGGTGLVALGGGAGIVTAMTGLVVLARRRPAPAAAAPVAVPVAEPFEPIDVEDADTAEAPGWTPQPLPKPLHLSRGTIAASVMASIAEAEQLKRAANDAELAERAERMEPQVPVLRPPAASVDQAPTRAAGDAETRRQAASASEPANPYARMGIVEGAEPGIGDLDQVLRRRRTAV